MLQIVIYHDSYRLPSNKGRNRTQEKLSKKEDSIHRSIRRSKTAIFDIIQCNTWQYWTTFTFNPKKVDRFSFAACSRKMQMWLDRQKGLKYLIVHELHKNGAIHFHALLSDYNGSLKDTGHKTKHGQPIYKGNFRSGFNEFVKIDQNKEAIAKYMVKQYITKDMPLLFGRKRYWTSRNLTRPQSFVNGVTKFNLWGIVKNRKPEYINDSLELHQIPKSSLLPLTKDLQTALFVPDVL